MHWHEPQDLSQDLSHNIHTSDFATNKSKRIFTDELLCCFVEIFANSFQQIG
jgi:hypothetical protein